MSDQRFRMTLQSDGLCVITQESGGKLTVSEAAEMCQGVAVAQDVPLSAVRLRLDYELLPNPTITGFVPNDAADAEAIQDVARAAVRRLDKLNGGKPL